VVVSIVYIATGGVKAIVWTNVFQALMFLGAGALTLGYLVTQIDGGLGAIVQVAGAAGRLNVVNWGRRPGRAISGAVSSATEHRVVALLNRLHRIDGRVRDRPRPDAAPPDVETRRQSQRTLALTPVARC